MKIADLRTTIVAVPQKREYRSSWRRGYQGSTPQIAVLIELETDDGLIGIGESPAVWAGQPEVTVTLIDAVRHLILDADPFEHDILRRRIYAETGMAHLGTQGLSWAISGVDMALWDLVGRAVGQPLHRLWGGAWRTRSPFHADVPPRGGRRGPPHPGRRQPGLESCSGANDHRAARRVRPRVRRAADAREQPRRDGGLAANGERADPRP
jgi:L-alanine-DL-glutamate epimerase-like enolase superfamily enzyme